SHSSNRNSSQGIGLTNPCSTSARRRSSSASISSSVSPPCSGGRLSIRRSTSASRSACGRGRAATRKGLVEWCSRAARRATGASACGWRVGDSSEAIITPAGRKSDGGGAEDADGDLAAVGDQQLLDRRGGRGGRVLRHGGAFLSDRRCKENPAL